MNEGAAPAGIYVHLPYCRSRCGYCSFVVTTDPSSRTAYLQALDTEAALEAEEASGATFDSLYFGGGTPSLIPPADLARLSNRLRALFDFESGSEITMEANPDDVSGDLARLWSEAGINRVSLGVQSFADRELSAVGRRHDAASARRALSALLDAGLSVSGDLILGLPEQTEESFRASARELAASGVGHVSVYLLETEKSKIIEEDRALRPERYLSDDAQADLWLELGEILARAGLHHYEISNWARSGARARHNEKYWRRVPTLGLGVSAHELWSGRRRANVSGLPAYLDALAAGRRPTALDRPIDAAEEARERIVLGLRLTDGVPEAEIEDWISAEGDSRLAADYAGWREAGWLLSSPGRVRFSERGFLVSNEILCRFV
ncbi:MAG: radical SAM family heme chaperone HemW [Acidobacteria bacterium]|nr:radical SAM family heme chaperone HemW [Acidobacteriota bacterium]MCA1611660.1 radical SAM family heme chaperone HemW [Acidobacteriota bacterium]